MRRIAVRVYADCKRTIWRMSFRGFHQCRGSDSAATFDLAISSQSPCASSLGIDRFSIFKVAFSVDGVFRRFSSRDLFFVYFSFPSQLTDNHFAHHVPTPQGYHRQCCCHERPSFLPAILGLGSVSPKHCTSPTPRQRPRNSTQPTHKQHPTTSSSIRNLPPSQPSFL